MPAIDRPSNPVLRFVYRAAVSRFGKVISPLRVIYARKLRLLPIATLIDHTMEHGLSLEAPLRLLIRVQASRANGCAFCEDLALAQAVRSQIGPERFDALQDFQANGFFSDREGAALAFTLEAVRDRRVSDETFARVRNHYSEVEIVELAWLAAAETYFNVQAHALGLGSDGLAALASTRA